jgi:hypothetical protein
MASLKSLLCIFAGLGGFVLLSTPAKPLNTVLPFQTGEKLTYRISWSNIIEAGTAQLAVTACDKANLLKLEMKAMTAPSAAGQYPFSDEFVSYFDTVLHAPSVYEKSFTERKRVVKERVTFSQLHRLATFTNSKNQTKQVPIDLGTQDPVSALYALRSVGLSPGMRVTFPVLDGGTRYWLDAHVIGVELINVKSGNFSAHRVEVNLRTGSGAPGNRQITAWFTSDARRVPVLVSAALPVGAAVVELTGQTP